jgi:hypothetical protein
MDSVVYTQLTQAALIKAKHPDLPVFVYTSMGWAFGMNAGTDPIMNDPAYQDFFLRSGDGYEFSQTNCQQAHTSPAATGGRCTGYFWNFGNASARDYFIENLVAPLALAPMIDGIFYDAVNYGYDIPEVRPWGKYVTNIANCTGKKWPDGTFDYSGCEVLLNGTLDVARRTAELLNQHNKIPMLANPASFVNDIGAPRHIWMDEKRLVKALDGTVRCAFSDRNLHSMMPLVPAPAPLKLVHACGQCHSSRVPLSYRLTL